MKITVEHTDRCSSSDHGIGRVWEGTTDQGTPVKVLICGLLPGSDDPVLAAQFEREHDAIPDMPPVCPECGEPMEEHKLVAEVRIDMYEVMARMLIGFGDSKLPMPPGETPAALANRLRDRLALVDKEYHDDLVRAANGVTLYVVERLMAAQGITNLTPTISGVAGHA